jgi:phosphomannomutase
LEWKTRIALLPQKSFNVIVDRKVPISEIMGLSEDIEEIEAGLPQPRRVNVRYSGTESKMRGLIESPEKMSVEDAWGKLKKSILSRMLENDISATIQ